MDHFRQVIAIEQITALRVTRDGLCKELRKTSNNLKYWLDERKRAETDRPRVLKTNYDQGII